MMIRKIGGRRSFYGLAAKNPRVRVRAERATEAKVSELSDSVMI